MEASAIACQIAAHKTGSVAFSSLMIVTREHYPVVPSNPIFKDGYSLYPLELTPTARDAKLVRKSPSD